MEHKLMKRAAVWCLCFFAAAMGIMIYLSFQKSALPPGAEPVSAQAQEKESASEDGDEAEAETQRPEAGAEKDEGTDKTPDESEQGDQETEDEKESGEVLFLSEGEEEEFQKLTFSAEGADTSYLRIPLPDGCKAGDIAIENYYMDQEMWILIDRAESDFYAKNAISGNQESVRQGIYEETEKGTKLRFKLTGIFEYHTILENNELYISFLNPREVYDKIVVIDPACGGLQTGYTQDGLREKEINLAIAGKLKEKLDRSGIKAYFTRMDDVNPGQESRIRLANEIRADLCIRIELGADEDGAAYGTAAVYNEDYFIPGFGSMELAKLLEEEVVSSIKGKGLGLEKAPEDEDFLRYITVPAAALKAGYATNKQEAALLVREEYQEKIAAGIYNAILKAYE